jgi:predicted 2-oxoglutarate/Fe(II)-dependent dioxygenase YbiX
MVAKPILTAAECAEWIRWGETTGFTLEKHSQTSNIAHRDNGRLAVESAEIASAIFERLRPFVPAQVGRRRVTGCNPNLRFYKYGVGQRFGRHVDQSNRLADGSTTEFTVLLYLSDDGLAGGETIFYADHYSKVELLRFAPQAGVALIHAHGDRCLTHEAAEVTRGVKYLLRTDLAFA